jgi:hypothetical protein
MTMSTAPKDRPTPSRTWTAVLARAALVLAVLLLLAATGFLLVALTGDGWAWLGYYYAGVIALLEVPAVVLAVVALRGSKVAPGRGLVAAAAALLALGPLLLWGIWGLYS